MLGYFAHSLGHGVDDCVGTLNVLYGNIVPVETLICVALLRLLWRAGSAKNYNVQQTRALEYSDSVQQRVCSARFSLAHVRCR